jgi:predicted 2-oxoglutarate/Fe(II)-dependent dioxygenase YbiX
MKLSPGDPFPHFAGRTPTNVMRMDYMPGRYIALAFLPASASPAEIREVMAVLAEREALFDDSHICFFGVLNHPRLIATAQDSPPGIRWFLDPDGDLFRQSGMPLGGEGKQGGWIVLDPALRVMKTAPLSQSAEIGRWIAELPGVDGHSGTRMNAPVLIVPRVLEPEICKEAIALHRRGQSIEGLIVSEIDGVASEPYVDRDYRSARQVSIADSDLRRRIEARIHRRLAPEMLKALRYEVGDVESWFVAAYDSDDGVRFRAHRDNVAPLQHRQFTLAINLNAEDYEGGDLRFPEYGAGAYRAPTGGAIVFASSLLHEVTLLTRGRRYTMVAFFVDRPRLESRAKTWKRRSRAEAAVH